jgi:outer membrane biosynthesis protein TonB
LIAPGNGAEELFVYTLVAHRVRAVRLAAQERVPGDRPWQRYDQAFRDTVEKVGPAFPERNQGLVEWAELLAREVQAGEIIPGVERILNPLPEPEPEPVVEVKVEAPKPKADPEKKVEAKKPEPKKDEPKPVEKKKAT